MLLARFLSWPVVEAAIVATGSNELLSPILPSAWIAVRRTSILSLFVNFMIVGNADLSPLSEIAPIKSTCMLGGAFSRRSFIFLPMFSALSCVMIAAAPLASWIFPLSIASVSNGIASESLTFANPFNPANIKCVSFAGLTKFL